MNTAVSTVKPSIPIYSGVLETVVTPIGLIHRRSESLIRGNYACFANSKPVNVSPGTEARGIARDIIDFGGADLDAASVAGMKGEALMLLQCRVEAARHAVYVGMLMRARRELSAAEFLERYQGLAVELGEMAVFNAVDTVPAQWLASLDHEPHWRWIEPDEAIENFRLGSLKPAPAAFTREQAERGAKVLDLTQFQDADFRDASSCSLGEHDGDGLNCAAQLNLALGMAAALGLPLLTTPTDPGHWVRKHAIGPRQAASMRIEADVHDEHSGRLMLYAWRNDVRIMRCRSLAIVCGDLRAQPKFAVPVVKGRVLELYLPPDGQGGWHLPDERTLGWLCDYYDSKIDAVNELMRDSDERAVEDAVLAILEPDNIARRLKGKLAEPLGGLSAELKGARRIVVSLTADGRVGEVTLERG